MKKPLQSLLKTSAVAALLTSMTACQTNAPFAQNPGFNPALRTGAVGSLATARNGKKWTVAIHLAADNNLYSAGLDDLNEIEAGLAKNPNAAEQMDVIVLFDGIKQGDSVIYRMKADPAGNNSTIVSEKLDDKGAVVPPSKEIDSGSAETFARFVDFVTKNFPAQNNSISIWNHGSGIYRGNPSSGDIRSNEQSGFFDVISSGQVQLSAANPSKSFASDDNGGHMELKDLNPALAIANKNLGKKLDIFGFDTCLMQYVETAYQIKDQANILVASEELEPGDGWDYEAYIGAIAQNPNMNPTEVASMMVDVYGKSYRPGGSQRGRDVTLSAIDINSLVSNLVPAMANLGNEMKASLATDKAALSTARNKTQTFYNRDSVDLGDFLKNLSQTRNGRLAAASAQVQQAISQTVINETHYGPSVDRATGVQVYFPSSTQRLDARYSDASFLRFAETRAWGDFLKAYTAK